MLRSIAWLAMVGGVAVVAAEPNRPEDLFPLEPGSTWTYRIVGQDERFVIRAIRQEMVNEQTCTLLEASVRDRPIAREHVAFSKDGLFRHRVEKEVIDPPVPIFRWPSPRGTIRVPFRLGMRAASATLQQSWGETSVPAGKFKTLNVTATLIEAGFAARTTTASFAEGVGMVRQVIDEFKRPVLILELEKFEPGAAK